MLTFAFTWKMASLLTSVLCSLSLITCDVPSPDAWHQRRSSHESSAVSSDQLGHLAGLSNMQQFENLLDPILVPRVVGTQNHANVKKYLKDQMQQLGWAIETDKFSDNTPLGKKTFENIIATLDPQAPRRLVIACHFDSKYTESGAFVGAIDSAVPCAMMINLARDLSPQLNALKNSDSDLALQFIFFDGEEAFKKWNSRDSIYGARHLAAKLHSTPYPENTNARTTHLHRMDLMVLLDLLGAPNPKFFSNIPSGDKWFRHMANIESRLRQKSLLSGGSTYFSFESTFGGIEDDHIPFMKRGVPILHLIPLPFPRVWHTDADDKSALDFPTIDNLNKILRVFVAEYLGLPVA